MPIKLILFGLPGSGKDTQARQLSDNLEIPVLSIGELLREEASRDTELGRLIAPHLRSGTIVPDWVAEQIMRERIQDPGAQRRGYVCVNYPRSRGSFEEYLLWDRPTAVVVIDVPEQTARARLLLRRRVDDTKETVDARILAYHETNAPTYEWLATTNIPVIRVDGADTVEAVTNAILSSLPASQ